MHTIPPYPSCQASDSTCHIPPGGGYIYFGMERGDSHWMRIAILIRSANKSETAWCELRVMFGPSKKWRIMRWITTFVRRLKQHRNNLC